VRCRLDNSKGQQEDAFKQLVPQGWNGFAYVYEGSGTVGGVKGRREQVPEQWTLFLYSVY